MLGGVNISFATTTGTFFAAPVIWLFTRAISFRVGGVCGMNSPLRGIGCVVAVFCSALCGTGFSSIP